MKTKLITVLIVLIITCGNLFSQTWNVKFNNSGNIPWMGGWHIGSHDDYTKIDDNGIFVNEYTHGYAATINDDPWPDIWWYNGGSGSIESLWGINPNDMYYPLKYGSTLLIYCINPNTTPYYSKVLSYGGGSIYGESFDEWHDYGISGYPGWSRNNDDRYVIGYFKGESDNQQLLLVCNSSNWATLFKIYSPISWDGLWSNGGNGHIDGWDVNSNDIYLAANVDGGPEDELICINNSTHWCTIYKFQNSTWNVLWTNSGSNSIGGWTMSNTTQYTIGDFNDDRKSDILFTDFFTGWATIKNFQNSTSWPDFYTNLGNGNLNSWDISGNSHYFVLNNSDIFTVDPLFGLAMLQQFTYPTPPCQLSLKIFPEGFYRSVNSMVDDTISVHLRDATSPFSEVEVKKSVRGLYNIFPYRFTQANFEQDYYIEVTHRNSIETWSAQKIKFHSIEQTTYDFTSSASSAYGSNEIQVETSPVKFAIYGGDVNQDGVVDMSDQVLINNAALNYVTGYVPEDADGSGAVDISDEIIAFNNSNNYVTKIVP